LGLRVGPAQPHRAPAGGARPQPRPNVQGSTLNNWSKRIACCSWGVITSCWPCLSSNLGASAMVAPIVARTCHGVKL
jgi:hypothetical protein